MHLPERIRQQLPRRHFGDPCSQSDIARAEQALGEQLPKTLRELYLASMGSECLRVVDWTPCCRCSAGRLVASTTSFGAAPNFRRSWSRSACSSATMVLGDIGGSSGLLGKVIRWAQSGARTSRSTGITSSMHGLPRGGNTRVEGAQIVMSARQGGATFTEEYDRAWRRTDGKTNRGYRRRHRCISTDRGKLVGA